MRGLQNYQYIRAKGSVLLNISWQFLYPRYIEKVASLYKKSCKGVIIKIMNLRKAKIEDVRQIYNLVNYFAQRGEMLPRSQSELYENIRDFFVVEEEGELIGCCALHILWNDLAEVKSLVVAQAHQGKGIGKMLVRACLEEARLLGVRQVFALTFKPAFFEKLGFKPIDKEDLPRKVWGECIKCPLFPDCKEEAVILEL